MSIRIVLNFCFIVLVTISSETQPVPFSISLEPFKIDGLGGIQSFAYGQHEGKWLVVGGRLDGLHQRQPFASFDIAGHNNQIFVIDPLDKRKWSAPLSSLPVAIQEHLKSTNMEFYQDGKYLYIVGGYGFSSTLNDHTTFPNLTAIEVPSVIDAILKGGNFSSFIRQINDSQFKVTGGRLGKIDGVYHLVGGQSFTGRYNPMGPGHGPGFSQVYTNQIRKFLLTDNGSDIRVQHLQSFTDAQYLHRRDFNVVPQIFPDGRQGLTAFSGVFQQQLNLPFLNSVDIDATSYVVNNDFSQYYNHYHCAHAALYSKDKNEMHTIFFGGIAQYYDSSGILVQDNNVPFVQTIARVTRSGDGKMAEYKLPVKMPGLLGAGSEFIPLENLSHFENGVLNLDDLPNGATLAGYIFGGINSTAANIFWTNDGTQSVASSQFFKVNIIKNPGTNIDELNQQSSGSLKLLVYPNPNNGDLNLQFYLAKSSDVFMSLWTLDGQKLAGLTKYNLPEGNHHLKKQFPDVLKQQAFLLKFSTSLETETRVVILEK